MASPRSKGALVAAVALSAALACWPRAASAHGMRSAYLEITEDAPGAALVRLRTTVPSAGVAPALPERCSLDARPGVTETDSGDVRSWLARCNGPLAGGEVGVTGLGPSITEAVVHARLADGRVHTSLLSPSAPRTTLPAVSSRVDTAKAFVAHGLRHIAGGADHLLFLVLLVLTLRRTRAVLAAEAAFTASHTLSFAATALGLVHVSPAAAEACIALSLVLVALDVAPRPGRAPTSTRSASTLAFAFGLVHGLGFAGGLTEIGLPDAHAAWALAGFGVGLEIGQLAVCLAALLAVRVASRWRHAGQLERVIGFASGALASAWLFERLSTVM